MHEIPTEADFDAAISAPDVLNLAIKAHGEIERAVKATITLALAEPHELEIERLSFPLKVDLAVALGVIHGSVRPLLLKLNKTRNLFAHDSRARFTPDDAQDVLSTLTSECRKNVEHHVRAAVTPRDILRVAFTVAFVEAVAAAERVQERKRQQEDWVSRVDRYFETVEKGGEGARSSSEESTLLMQRRLAVKAPEPGASDK